MNWQDLASTSHYQTAVAVGDALRRDDITEAKRGIEELRDALSRADKRSLRSYLTQLMAHIIKWRVQPELRSRSWRATIKNCRQEIEELREETPSLTRDYVESIWQKCFETATDEAEGQMNRASEVKNLTWEEVFVERFELK